MPDVEITLTTLDLVIEPLAPYSISTDLPTPLFVVGEGGQGPLGVLQSRVRLSGLKSSTDAYQMFLLAVSEVRTNFYRRVPINTIVTLLQTVYTPTPVNQAQTLRMLAAATEIEWVRLLLLRRLKVFFADHSAQARELWNEDGLTRAMLSDKELARIEAGIMENLDLLSGDVSFQNESNVNVTLLEPDTKPLPAGASVWTQAQKNDWRRRHG